MVAALSAACSFPTSGPAADGDDVVSDDVPAIDAPPAPIDAAPAPDATPCLGFTQSPRIFSSCDLPDPDGAPFKITTSGTYVVDTDAGTVRKGNDDPLPLPAWAFLAQATPGLPEVFAIVGAGIEIKSGVSLTVTGTRALALVSTSNLELGGFIRATPREVGGEVLPGPGASEALCTLGDGADGVLEENQYGEPAAGGGGGGGFGGPGGEGGPVWRPADDAGDAAAGGAAHGGPAPAALRGGCWGGDGELASDGGAGGAPGGGVALIAVGGLALRGGNAVVTTSGFGGAAADNGSPGGGGGGGGSGGTIWIVASSLEVDGGRLTANGGGGGEGDSAAGNANPQAGQDGKTDDDTAALGGDETWGGNGGDGAGPSAGEPAEAGETCTPAAGDTDGCGGGGGGGGPGYIFVRADTVLTTGNFVVAPALTPVD